MTDGCIFCRIVAEASPSRFNAESETCVAFTPKEMAVPGHQLVIPKLHYETIYDIPNCTLADLIEFVQRVTLAMRVNLGVEGVNLLHASGAAAQQSVPHFHIHLLPRFQGDGIDAWPSLPGSEDTLGSFWPGVT